MFLPLDRKPDWRSPPLITLLLVIANALVFYMWQFNDDQHEQDAFAYYTQSELDLIELKAYIEYKTSNKNPQFTTQFSPKVTQDTYTEMLRNGDFQKKLAQNLIIEPDAANYNSWRLKRDQYERLKARSVSSRYAFNPSQPTVTTYFTSLFLHQDSAHLIGNLALLIFLGLGIEILMGRSLFLLGYMASGLSANFFTTLFYADEYIELIGASGAIAGLMGMAIVIYGLRKIQFFYFLIFYFDVITARAIWLLPIYILSQAIIEFVFDTNTIVIAHIGGFMAGLAFTGILKLIPNALNATVPHQSQQKSDLEQGLNEARTLLARLDIDNAKIKLLALEKKYPDNTQILQQLFTIAKYDTATEEYHAQAIKLLNLPGTDTAITNIIYATYRHYASHAKPKPRWTPDLLVTIAGKLAANNKLSDAESLINFLLKSTPDFSRNAEGLASLIKYFSGVEEEKVEKYKTLLHDLYPDSNEAKYLQ